MAVIDDKVVAMSFESSKFESGVNKTISSLDKLKAALQFPNAGKGLDDINAAAKKVDLSHIAQGVDSIKDKLGALSVAALAIFANIAMKAVQTGAQLVKAFTIDPMKAGFAEYSTNLNAIQTILANTQAAGATLDDVNKALLDLNKYSDKTIYNFSQMAKNIGTFTAAGVDLDTSTAAIKGIANLAALSGSNAEQASTAMYQLSQAISSGAVKLQDWNSVVNAGMGGTVFQRALAQTAEAMGTLEKGAVKLTGPMKNVSIAGESFRNSLSKPGKDSWLTSKVLTTTLQQFTGDLTNAQLKAQGFNDAQIKAIQQTAKTAMHAATEVKTLSQVLDVAKETAGSGWAQTWQIIFGNFGEAKTTFTALSNTINGFINVNAAARNKVLADWKALGGRTVLIDSIKTAFHNLGEVLKPIKEAFRDIFPAATGRDLFALTKRFQQFAEALKPSRETVDNLKRTFRGLFAILDIGKQIIGGIFTVFGKLFGAVGDGSGSFLEITANIGDFLVKVDLALKKGDKLHNFFATLGTILSVPLKILSALGDAIANLFSGISPGGDAGGMSFFQQFMESISVMADKALKALGELGKLIRPVIESYISAIQSLGPAISQALSTMNFDAILKVIQTGLFAGLVLMFRKFLGKGSFLEQLTKVGGGLVGNVSKSFGALAGSLTGLQGALTSVQNNLKAKTLKEIAISIGILALSLVALSFIDPKKLNTAIGGMTVAFGELLGAMAILDKIGKAGGFIKMPFIAGSMILLAGAIDVLTIAVIALSRLSWNELIKGLGGVAALMGTMVVAVKPLSASSAGLIRAGIGITAIAVALRILASAVAAFGDMNLSELSKGLVGVAAGLGILVVAAKAMPPGMVVAGVGLIAMAYGLKIMADVVAKFGAIDWRTMGKGLIGVAGSLIVIAGAMQLMPQSMVLQAAGLLLVSIALGKIAAAVMSMGGMSITQIAKGLGTLAGSLVILAAALYVMSGTLAGAAALAVAAAGLALLTPALVTLGKQSWTQIIKGLTTLAAALTILGIAGLLITPVIPSLLGLGVALVLIGGGLALAGAGIFLIATGLSALVVAAPTGVGIILQAFVQLERGIIENVKLLILGLLEIVRALAVTAPQFVDALVKILNSLLDVVIQAAPKIVKVFEVLIDSALQVLNDKEAPIIQAGFNLLLALLQGIENNIPQLVTVVIGIVTKFLTALAAQYNKIVTAGFQILTSLLKGITDHISMIVTTVLSIYTNFLTAIASNLGRIVTAGGSIIIKLIEGIAKNIKGVLNAGTDAIVAFVQGIGEAGERIVKAARESAAKFIHTLATEIVKLADDVFTALITLINGMATVIEKRSPELRAAGKHLGWAIIDGMTLGLGEKAHELYDKAHEVISNALDIIHKVPLIGSPSQVTTDVGKNIILGLVKGLDDNAQKAYDSAETMSLEIIKKFNEVFQTASPSKVMYEIGKYVGQGFAEGLRGSQDDVRSAFDELNQKLTDAMRTARETIASEQDKLDKLRASKKPDAAAIAEAQKVIKENQELLRQSTAGHIALTKTLSDEKAKLIGLIGDYEKIGEKLKAAQDALKEAQKTRADAIQSFTDQYSTLPDVVTQDAEGNSIDQLAAYEDALKHQADAIGAYQATLDQLRALGLDDATYQKLLTEGTADQQFATQLLSGGKTAVEGLNKLDAQLLSVSKTLAINAANNLYNAGVKSAQGLVKGLTSQKQRLINEIEQMADEIVAAFNRRLSIKSPSKVFEQIGVYAMEGLAIGFTKSTKVVTDAVDDAAKEALAAMRKSMGDISTIVTDELDANPVITPILDLTQVRTQVEELGALTTVVPITAAASFQQASAISSQQTAAQAEEAIVAPGGTSVKFEQNNYSPEALTNIEIYRQTKNQLSQLRSVLSTT